MTILGADLSHFQPNPNFAQVKASGRSFVVLKATEGTGYTDPTMAARRAAAHAAGLIVGLYHFARAGDPAAEARYFLSLIGALQPGEFLVLDWEVSGANPPAWCKAWLDAVYAATGVRPLIYMNSSAMTGSNWSAVVAGSYALWLASYDNSTAPPAVKWWAAAAMKQFSDAGNVLGIGTCDVDVFYGTAAQLLAYGKGGSTPIQEDDDMKLIQSPTRGTAVIGPGYFKALNAEEATVAAALYGTALQCNDRQFDVARAVCMNGSGLQHNEDLYTLFCGGPGVAIPPPSGVAGDNGKPTNLANQVLYTAAKVSQAQPGAVDPVALAAALVADDTAVDKLADALAAALAQRLQS